MKRGTMMVRVGVDGVVGGRAVRAGAEVEIAEADWPEWLEVRAMPALPRSMTMELTATPPATRSLCSVHSEPATARSPHVARDSARSAPADRIPHVGAGRVVDPAESRRLSRAAMPPKVARRFRHPA